MRTDVRTCRVCGCWELQACEDGCSWVEADRCSACPADAVKAGPITVHHLQTASSKIVGHDAAGSAVVVTHQLVEFPNVVTTIMTRRGAAPEVHIYVGAMEVASGDLATIAVLLNEATELKRASAA